MYGTITVPGGLGFSPGADGTVDKETQDKLVAALQDAVLQADITGSAATADKLATAFTLALTGAVSGEAQVDGSGRVEIATESNDKPILGELVLTASGWVSDGVRYLQPAQLPGLTADARVDLYAPMDVEASLASAIQPCNDSGAFYAVTGTPPETDITVQYTIMPVRQLAGEA